MRSSAEHDWFAQSWSWFLKDCLERGIQPEGGVQLCRDLIRAASQAAREARDQEDMLVGKAVDLVLGRLATQR